MANTPLIETERLILRKFTEKDVNSLFLILSDIEVNTFLPMFPLKNIKEAEQYLQNQYLDKYKIPNAYHYAICLKSDNIPIGYLNISDTESYDFGYGLKKEFWHRGITTEAGIAVIEQLKKDNILYITATHDINNPRSGAVMRKLGMIYQYSYEELWQPKNILVTFRMYQLNLDGKKDRVYRGYWNKYPVHFVEKEI